MLLAGCAGLPPAAPVGRLVVFGDSNVDNGNMFRLSGGTNPGPPNWRGRNSNGPVVVEYLAAALGARLEDHAVSGATTGRYNLSLWIDPANTRIAPTGVLSQLDAFEKSGGRLGPADIAMLWAGSNDLFGVRRSDAVDLNIRVASAAANLETAIERLRALGARRIVVANRLPRASADADDDLNGTDLNASIAAMVARQAARPGARVELYDAYASIRRMMSEPSPHGFAHPATECLAAPACISERFEDGLRVADGFVHFDGAHKTTHAHRLMADELFSILR